IDNRVRHTLPTRRSSDRQRPLATRRRENGAGLNVRREWGRWVGDRVAVSLPAPRGSRSEADNASGCEDSCGEYEEGSSQRKTSADRKSTRLNSSHVKISY